MKRINEGKYGFKTVSSIVEHKNPYYSVFKEEILYPDGKKHTYWVQNKDDFSIIIPIFPDKTTILVGQYRIPADFYSWEFPMGSTEGKDPLEAAKKEFIEETGYNAEHWQQIGSYLHAPGRAPTVTSVFIAQGLSEGEAHPEEKEILQLKHVSINEVENMIRSHIIQDGPTIVAYHYLEKYLQNG